jgi:hypothetical protein
MFHDLKQSLEAARSLVDVVASQADRRDEVVSSIILLNHPFFSELKKVLNVPYRFVVETIDELKSWMGARGFSEEIFSSPEDDLEWFQTSKSAGTIHTVKISREIFDENERLKPFTAAEWREEFISSNIRKTPKSLSFADDLDEDIPF